jgi:hypothetical protein
VLFVSFVVKNNTDKKSDFTAENAKIAGEFTTKSTKKHEDLKKKEHLAFFSCFSRPWPLRALRKNALDACT